MARFPLACALLLAMCAAPALARGPIIDYDCALKCIAKDGWNPICVADGRTDSEGTLYANECTYTMCVTAAWLDSDTPRYDYLPLDCGSAVGCSLMGRAVDQCEQVWLGQTDTSPKTDDACACGLKTTPEPEPVELAKRCMQGRNGCLRCSKSGQSCRACQLGYRLGGAGVCRKCQVEGCLSCPRSVAYCAACDRSRGYRRTADYQCVRRGSSGNSGRVIIHGA